MRTNAFEELSAARDVVLDKQKTTIWRESGARVGPCASTHSCPMWTSAWTSRPFARCANELTGKRRANKMLQSCRPERRHILFRPRSLKLRNARAQNHDLAFVTYLCARAPCFRAGRGRLACCNQRRALSRFYLRRRRQCAGARSSAYDRRAGSAGAKSLARLESL